MNKPFSLSKNERLKSKKNIDTLFLNGKAFFVFPFSVKYLINQNHSNNLTCLQLVASVPKRKFKKAHDRNRIRRRLKESYRIQKGALKQLLEIKQMQLHVLFMYSSNDEVSYDIMFEKMNKAISVLEEKVRNELQEKTDI